MCVCKADSHDHGGPRDVILGKKIMITAIDSGGDCIFSLEWRACDCDWIVHVFRAENLLPTCWMAVRG